MQNRLRDFMEQAFAIPENVGEDKVIGLDEAVRANVKPGMTLLFCGGSCAALYQVIREYRGKNSGFTVVNCLPTIGMDLVHCGLVKKLIAQTFGEIRPRPRLNNVFARAYKEKSVKFEALSNAGLSLRLLAGALGVGFIPTKSMLGTSLAVDNESIQVIDEPFGSGKKVAILKSLDVDLAIVHALAADRYGNAILPSPAGGIGAVSDWASFAARSGVILTTERLVSTAFIREHSSLVKVPGYRVKSVSIAPFGAHPLGLYDWGIKELSAYDEDIDFQSKHQEATREPARLDDWLEEWVFSCSRHEDYLGKLGFERLALLTGKTKQDFWKRKMETVLDKISTDMSYTPTEMMMVAASRKIQERILQNNYKTLLCGIGTSGMSGWLAASELRRKGYYVEVSAAGGMLGMLPRPVDPFLSSIGNAQTCTMIAEAVAGYSFIICGEHRRSLTLLSAAQVDKYGNLNSGKISENLYLQGPGGAGDAYQASEAMAILSHSKGRFLEKVPYITSAGNTVKTLVSTLGVFEKVENDAEFTLTACLPHPEFKSLEDKVRNIKDNCGWNLKVASRLEQIALPTFEELMLLRAYDPDNYFRS